MTLYTRLSREQIADWLGVRSDGDRLVADGVAVGLRMEQTRAERWPWWLELEPPPLSEAARELAQAWLARLLEHEDVTGDRIVLVLEEQAALRVRNFAPADVWRVVWQKLEEQATGMSGYPSFYPELRAGQARSLAEWLEEPGSALTLWAADIVGVRVTVRNPHVDVVSVGVELVEPVEERQLHADTVQMYQSKMRRCAQELTADLKNVFPTVAPVAGEEEEGPYPLWWRSDLALRLDLWRWIYYEVRSSGRSQNQVLAELETTGLSANTIRTWRRGLKESWWDDEALRAWESGLPEEFSLSFTVAAILKLPT